MAAVALFASAQVQGKGETFLDPTKAGPDFAIQGEYTGNVKLDDGKQAKVGVQVIALGDGAFRAVLCRGGLPGDGWDKKRGGDVDAKQTDGILKLKLNGGQWHATIHDGVIEIADSGGQKLGQLKRVIRKSPTLGQKPPPGAVVLFDGKNADEFAGGRMSEDGFLMQGMTSKQKFLDCKLHFEFRLPFMPSARGQGRGNSGCYLQARHEVQILDSFGLPEDDSHCGGIYSVGPPAENMCFPPLSWQTYDIEFTAARYDPQGEKTKNALLTVRHNGVLIQDNVEVPHATTAAPLKEGPTPQGIHFQDHGNPVRFRNIWVVPTKAPANADGAS